MKGPLNVIRRRRAERPANGVETAQAATEAPTQAQPTAGLASTPPPPAADQPAPAAGDASAAPPTAEQQAAAEVPAGQEPVPARPSFRQRGRLRRRLRYLRRVRELGFRDLGGLVFDQHRFSQANEALVHGKLSALAAVDGELRALEHALDDRRPLTELREPGVSVCSRCGALHGSEARFCPSCGTPVRGPLAIAEVGEAVSLPGRRAARRRAGAPPRPRRPAQPLAPAPAAAAAGGAGAGAGRRPSSPPRPTPPGPPPAGEQPTEVMRPVDEEAADRPPTARRNPWPTAAASAASRERRPARRPAGAGHHRLSALRHRDRPRSGLVPGLRSARPHPAGPHAQLARAGGGPGGHRRARRHRPRDRLRRRSRTTPSPPRRSTRRRRPRRPRARRRPPARPRPRSPRRPPRCLRARPAPRLRPAPRRHHR